MTMESKMTRIDNRDGRLNHMVGMFASTAFAGYSDTEVRVMARRYVKGAFLRLATDVEESFAVQCARDAE